MKKNSRLVGIDLLKGIAAFAVVLIHSEPDPGFSGTTDYWAVKVGQFSSEFAVPFFLATSFYLMIQKVYSNKLYSFSSRFKRLLLPYIFWSIIYLCARGFKYLTANNLIKLNSLLSDPFAFIFLGSASVQLYFIPLLISGIFLVTVVMKPLFKKAIDWKTLILLIVLSLLAYDVMFYSNNSFNLASGTAFDSFQKMLLLEGNRNPILRLILIEVSWMLRCLPYIFIAMLLNHPYFKKVYSDFDIRATLMLSSIVFTLIGFKAFGILNISVSVNELSIAYCSLLLGISLSTTLKENHVITNLGICSFGIFLMHHLVVELIKPIAYKFQPGYYSVVAILICAIPSFLISWAVTSCLMKSKFVSRYTVSA